MSHAGGLSRPLPLHMEARSSQPTPWCRPMWPRSYPSSCWESMAPPYLWNARPDPLGVGPLFRRYDWPLHGGREVGHHVAGTMRGPLARRARLALCLANQGRFHRSFNLWRPYPRCRGAVADLSKRRRGADVFFHLFPTLSSLYFLLLP